MNPATLPAGWDHVARLLGRDGLPLTARPYRDLGRHLGLDESAVMRAVVTLQKQGVINRFGVIMRNRVLGFTTNGMCVFDLPDADVAMTGRRIAALPFVSLCYARRRQPPDWPYNLFCMIHGRDRGLVLAQFQQVRALVGPEIPAEILISRRCFKQRGASYACEVTPWTPSTVVS